MSKLIIYIHFQCLISPLLPIAEVKDVFPVYTIRVNAIVDGPIYDGTNWEQQVSASQIKEFPNHLYTLYGVAPPTQISHLYFLQSIAHNTANRSCVYSGYPPVCQSWTFLYFWIFVNRFRYINNNITKDRCPIPMDKSVRLGPLKLSLQATIDHHGPSIDSGHYTASINCCKKTFYCNDHKIMEFGITD